MLYSESVSPPEILRKNAEFTITAGQLSMKRRFA